MSPSRRRFALCSAGLLSGIAGCTAFQSDDSQRDQSLEEVHLELVNLTNETRTFHFALEATDGLGQWHTYTADPGGLGDERYHLIEPDPDRMWTETHVITGDKRTTDRILKAEGGRTCLSRRYRLEEGQLSTIINSSMC